MARIRTIKPEFWSSEQVVECSTTARLLFVGLWNFCDDAGVHPDSPSRIKMQIFPGDPFSLDQIKSWIDELIKSGLIQSYSSEGRLYLRVTGWQHQKIDKPSYRYPLPNSSNGSGMVVGHSSNGSGMVADRSPPDRYKEEENEFPLPPKANPNPKTPPEFDSSLDVVWKKIADGLQIIKPKAVRAELTPWRRNAMSELIADGLTADKILSACRWFFTSADERAVNARKVGNIDTVLQPDKCTKYFEFSTDPDAWGKTRDGPEVAAKLKAADEQRRLVQGANRAG